MRECQFTEMHFLCENVSDFQNCCSGGFSSRRRNFCSKFEKVLSQSSSELDRVIATNAAIKNSNASLLDSD